MDPAPSVLIELAREHEALERSVVAAREALFQPRQALEHVDALNLAVRQHLGRERALLPLLRAGAEHDGRLARLVTLFEAVARELLQPATSHRLSLERLAARLAAAAQLEGLLFPAYRALWDAGDFF